MENLARIQSETKFWRWKREGVKTKEECESRCGEKRQDIEEIKDNFKFRRLSKEQENAFGEW